MRFFLIDAPVVQLSDVHLWRGRQSNRVHALRGVSFEVGKGQCVAILGPNGAGKSSTIGLILGLCRPDQGAVRVTGGSPFSLEVRKKTGCTPQDSGFLDYATVSETLRFVASHYPFSRSVPEILDRFRLRPIANRQTRSLSGGQKRLLSLACAFIGAPEVVVLDEPTTGLDPDLRRQLWSAIDSWVEDGKTVLLTTHYLDEAEHLADHVIVIDRGQVRMQGSVEEIHASLGYKRVVFDLAYPQSLKWPDSLKKLCHAEFIHEREKKSIELTTRNSDEFVKYITENLPFANLRVEQLSLEQVMLKIWSSENAPSV